MNATPLPVLETHRPALSLLVLECCALRLAPHLLLENCQEGQLRVMPWL
ncbi:MAG TPA: hypothetical protein VNU24_01135 [Solirubrobacteraceae bacterium]|nr:hypothetical protein [Solirubrobacteraceae bacterium]